MRALVRSLLTEGLDNNDELPTERWFGSGSITGDPKTLFAEIKFGGRFPGMGIVVRRRLEVWIHDNEGDYGRIEEWLKHVKSRLDGAEHQKGEDGSEIVLCTWVNDSTDLYDDGYRTNCMMSAFEIVGKEAT